MELISKDALVAEIEKLYDKDYLYLPSNIYELKDDLLAIIDELEVKEVDLDKYIDEYFKGWTDDYDNGGAACHYQYVQVSDCKAIAKHFFELGLKVVQNNS